MASKVKPSDDVSVNIGTTIAPNIGTTAGMPSIPDKSPAAGASLPDAMTHRESNSPMTKAD